MPSDINYLFKNKAIDKIIPSKWVTKSYIRELPSINNKIYEWPAGVNTNYWQPKLNRVIIIFCCILKGHFQQKNLRLY